MTVPLLRVLGLAAAIMTIPSAAAAADSRTVHASGSQMLALSDRLVKVGRRDHAETILRALAADPNPEIRNEARFRRSLMLENRGEKRQAAVLLRQILDENPDAAAARFKLATILSAMGDEGAALRELRALSASNLPPTAARFVDRLAASLQASKPFGVQVEFAVAPDSNINRATRSDTLGTVFGDFSIDEEQKSGLGAAVRAMAHARRPLSDNLNLVGRLSSEASLYRDKEFNDIAVDLAVGPELMLGRTRVAFEAGATQQWYGMKPLQRGVRASASIARPLDSVSLLRVDTGSRWTDNRFNRLQDGRGLFLRARYERALSPQMLVAVSAGADRFQARDDAYSTRSWTAGLTAFREVGRMTASAGIEVGRLQADDRLALLSKAREDRFTKVHAGAVFRQLTVGGFAPMARISIERNKSSVEFYDYRRTRTEFGVSRAF
jgi:tetratricopeptide (TPR) repeat protein